MKIPSLKRFERCVRNILSTASPFAIACGEPFPQSVRLNSSDRHILKRSVVISMKVDMNAGEDIKLELPQVGLGRRTEADAALEDVFRTQYPRLISVLVRVTSDRAQAEELASEVFCKLAKRPALFRPGNNMEGWLYRAAMNLAFDNLKAGARRKRHEDAAALENVRESSRTSSSPLDDILRAEQQRNVRVVL